MDKLENWCYKFDCKQTIIEQKFFYTFVLIVEMVLYFVFASKEPSGEPVEPVGVMEFFGNIYLTISKLVIEGEVAKLLAILLLFSSMTLFPLCLLYPSKKKIIYKSHVFDYISKKIKYDLMKSTMLYMFCVLFYACSDYNMAFVYFAVIVFVYQLLMFPTKNRVVRMVEKMRAELPEAPPMSDEESEAFAKDFLKKLGIK